MPRLHDRRKNETMIIKVRTWVVPEGEDSAATKVSDEYLDRIDRIVVHHDDITSVQGSTTHALGFCGRWATRADSVLIKSLMVYRDFGSFEAIEVYTAKGDNVASVEAWLMSNDGGTIDRLI